mgnify:FL=1
MKLVVTDAATVTGGDISLDFLKKYGEVEIFELTPPELVAERIKDADIVICNKTRLSKENMKSARKLKYIGLFATGYNNIDIDYAREHDIAVCNAPGYSTESVAQHTIALLMAIVNRVGEYNRTVSEGDWIKSSTFSYFPIPIIELNGKVLGIIGYGSIGRRVGDIARAFGMKLLVYNRSRITDPNAEQVDLDTLLKNADVVSLHCPLNDASNGVIGKDALAKMKQGAILINTARGPLIDEAALREALDSGKLAGAGVDVLCTEPMTADCSLYGAPNCFITPHIAWAGLEPRTRLMGIVGENIEAFLNGSPVNNVAK